MTDIRLRLEAPDGSSAKEYRIHDGIVQTRRQEPRSKYAPEGSWQRLTPQQLSDHVKRSTPVSHCSNIGWAGDVCSECVRLRNPTGREHALKRINIPNCKLLDLCSTSAPEFLSGETAPRIMGPETRAAN